nr:unnamed protein product [Haemonchus contortus]
MLPAKEFAELLNEAKETWEQLLEWEKCHAEELNNIVEIVRELEERRARGLVTLEQVAEVNTLCNYIKTMHMFDEDGNPRYTAEELAGAEMDVSTGNVPDPGNPAFNMNFGDDVFSVKKEEPCD